MKPLVKETFQITLTLGNTPGKLAEIAEVLAKADVSIDGISYTRNTGDTQTANFVVDKVSEAIQAVKSLGKEASSETIISLQFSDDKPGIIATVAHTLGNAGINIDNIYHAASGRGGSAVLYISVQKEHFSKAMELLKSL